MAYATTTVNNITDLRTFINTNCVANGYTLTGDVLSKGTLFVRTWVTTDYLNIEGRTSAAAGIAPNYVRLGAVGMYPLTVHFHLFSDNDEVFVFVHDAVGNYRWIAFGQSPVAGLPGSGNWFGASRGQNQTVPSIITPTGGGNGGGSGGGSGALFWQQASAYGANTNTSYFHHGFTGLGSVDGWSVHNDATYFVNAVSPSLPKLSYQPNGFNNQTVFARICPHISRGDSKVSMIGLLKHARYIRIDNVDPSSVITLGSDRWKVYPWMKKNAASRDGGVGDESGTFGIAIRYDGP